MKKLFVILISLILCISLFACSENESETTVEDNASSAAEDNNAQPMKLDAMEYTLYTNIFFNDQADQYANTEYTKEGIFTILHDVYSNCERYYVWGYADNTFCCDWQWEFVPDDTSKLPEPGSLLKVEGDFVADEAALDGYRLTDVTYSTVQEYKGAKGKYDMTTMSPTLTRVQLINMLKDPVGHTGEKVTIYGRIETDNQLQHPYYDNAWYIKLDYSEALPAIGTYVTVEGTFNGTTFDDSKIIVDTLAIDQQ